MNVSIRIERATGPTPDVCLLVGELEDGLSRLYVAEQQHGLALDDLFVPHIQLYVAHVDGAAVGCGGVALFDRFAELKRMFVRENARGRGIADAILKRLEDVVREVGLSCVKLETGIHQHAALRFYRRNGYNFCNPFPPYTTLDQKAIEASIFMDKTLG
jgi:putative acetyltransferase